MYSRHAQVRAGPDARLSVRLCFGKVLALHEDGRTSPIKVDAGFGNNRAVFIDGFEFIHLCIRAGSNNIVAKPTAVVRTTPLKSGAGTARICRTAAIWSYGFDSPLMHPWPLSRQTRPYINAT
jgi:hypothetical protein